MCSPVPMPIALLPPQGHHQQPFRPCRCGAKMGMDPDDVSNRTLPDNRRCRSLNAEPKRRTHFPPISSSLERVVYVFCEAVAQKRGASRSWRELSVADRLRGLVKVRKRDTSDRLSTEVSVASSDSSALRWGCRRFGLGLKHHDPCARPSFSVLVKTMNVPSSPQLQKDCR